MPTITYASNINTQCVHYPIYHRPYYPPNFPRPNPYRPHPIYPPRPMPMYRCHNDRISTAEVFGAALLLILIQNATNNANTNQNQINAGGNK